MPNYEKFNLGLEDNLKPNQKNKKKERPSFDESRRRFLKYSAIVGGGAAVSTLASPALKKVAGYFMEEVRDIEPPDPTPEQEKIEEEDKKSIREIIDFNKEGRIEFNLETAEALKNHWKERYDNPSDLKPSLEIALEKMAPWDGYLENEFEQAGVPENFRYLLIPESHGKWEAKSSVGAVGPYQFTPRTGISYGLATRYYKDCHPNIEERQDPIKSARACAEYLKVLHGKGGEDWDLALSGYNGGFYWDYVKLQNRGYELLEEKKVGYQEYSDFIDNLIEKIKQGKRSEIKYLYQKLGAGDYEYKEINPEEQEKIETKLKNIGIEKNKEPNYEDFLKLLEEVINQIRNEKMEKMKLAEKETEQEFDGTITHVVRKGDNLRKIAIKYRINIEELERLNQIKNRNKIYQGQKLKIPFKGDKEKALALQKEQKRKKIEDEFWEEINGFSENLNYPPKFNAVYELIEEKKYSQNTPGIQYETYKVPEIEIDQIYYFQEGDENIYKISLKFKGVSMNDILAANPKLDPHSLDVGDKILIPKQKAGLSLRKIAQQKNKPLKELIKLNPGIVNSEKEIPPGYEIRV